MKQTIKIKFVDFWLNFNPKDNYFYNFLNIHYNVQFSDNPDYLFFSVYGYNHLQYSNCIKIMYTGENVVPDFNFCDYALGFHYIDFENRYMRFPLYLMYSGFEGLKKSKEIDENLVNRKFCNFVYSNNVNADPLRTYFFSELSKYKKVDSGGRYLNNIGGNVSDKIAFIKDYKFTIAFENSCSNGYTTEKIMEPMTVMSLPIYFGNPLIENDFNQKSIVYLKNPNKIDELIQEVVHLDSNPNAYLDKLSQSWLTEEQKQKAWDKELLTFLQNIFSKPPAEAKKIPPFGYTDFYTERMTVMDILYKRQEKINVVTNKFKQFIKF